MAVAAAAAAAALLRRLWRRDVHPDVGWLRLLSWRLQTRLLRRRMLEADLRHLADVRLVGGVDVSFVKGSDTDACAALVVLELPSLAVVYEDCERVCLTAPYVPGFLAFREVRRTRIARAGLPRVSCRAPSRFVPGFLAFHAGPLAAAGRLGSGRRLSALLTTATKSE